MVLKKMQLKSGLTRAALLGVVLIGVTAGAMVIARRGPAVLAKATAAQSPAAHAPAAAPKQLLVAPAKGTGRTATTTPSRSAAATPAAKPSVVMAAAKTPAPAVEAPTDAVAQSPELSSLTGCLQHDDGTYRLKDTAGADAPKSRSWKSGFLKKRAASVEVVDSANRLGLPTHVGQRVTVTGVLLNKEMRARAVQRVGVCS